ncbi:protein unc-93 homolog A-like [Alosa pseudoharengus]|uniref:protein unc-93 homolog A-like n=1 Tax=Alosa pseudoharengus TaxID=34774 RepID=UPI003F89F537
MMIGPNMKNVLVVSFGFVCLFTAYGGLQNLQSSLNAEQGMGVTCLSVIYAALILSAMFVPSILIKNLGCKWTMVASMGCYVTYSCGNLYPGWATLIPTSAVLGAAGGPLWSAKCTYLAMSGHLQAQREGRGISRAQDLLTQYFGIFFAMFQSSAVWGNLLSSLIFSQDTHVAEIPEEKLQYCGVGLCADDFIQSGNYTRPEQKLVYTLMGCYIGVGLLAMALVAVFLDNIDREVTKEFRGNREPFCSTFLATIRLMRDRKLLLLIPMTIYSGLEQSFLWGEYTKNYVTCALGIHYIGFTMMCFGACDSLFSFVFGKIARFTGRIALFCLAALTNFGCTMGLLFWRPHPDHFVVFFLIPGLWGIADAVWQTQINALYGVLFPDHTEAAFANYRLWESLGFLMAFGYSPHLCLSTKTYLLLSGLAASVLTYPLLEYLVRVSPSAPVKYSKGATQEREMEELQSKFLPEGAPQSLQG